MYSILVLISSVVNIFVFLLLARIILEWLIYFEISNPYNRHVVMVRDSLHAVTEPALTPCRRFLGKILPRMPIDLSPILLVLLLQFAINIMWEIALKTGAV